MKEVSTALLEITGSDKPGRENGQETGGIVKVILRKSRIVVMHSKKNEVGIKE